jgi:plastocyanin
MRRILFITVLSALGLMLAPSAIAATKTVTITSTGFSPTTVSIVADDSVVWHNSDSRNHQVVAASGAFASPILKPGQSFRFTFSVPGTYGYRDALFPSRTGTVKVAGPPPAVSLAVSQPQIQFGQSVTLSGQVNNKKAGEQVLITAQPYGQLSALVLATVVTGNDGTFTLVTKPQILREVAEQDPMGVSKLRVAMSVNQAGVGYLPAFSREITVRTK